MIISTSFRIDRYFKRVLFKNSKHELVVDRLRQEIDATRNLGSRSSHKNRVTAVNAFERFINETMPCPICVDELTAEHIKAFNRWIIDNGNKDGYARLHLRCLRGLINRIIPNGSELFKLVRTSNCQTEKRAVSEETIKEIRDYDLSAKPNEALARDIFLFCFYGMGIPLIDAAMLKKTQLKNGHISYRRQKTGRLVTIAVGPELEQLIKHLSQNDSAYLLPILTSADRTETQRQYKRFYQRYMRALRKLSVGLNSECHLTSYTPRHSWASIAYKNGIDINVIARALGHANTNITYLYIKEINDTQLECANRLVMQALL